MVDAGDLKSLELCSCGFESRRPHQSYGAPVSFLLTSFIPAETPLFRSVNLRSKAKLTLFCYTL